MNKTIHILIVLGILALVFLGYAFLRKDNNSYNSTTKPLNKQSKSDNSELSQINQEINSRTNTETEKPKPDVSATFKLSVDNITSKEVIVKRGQRVELIFDANFEDEIRLDEYNINGIYVLPLSEHSTQFIADKPGEFRIYLVKRNKTIGTLIVK